MGLTVDAVAVLEGIRSKMGPADRLDPSRLERIDYRADLNGLHVYYFGSDEGGYGEFLDALCSELISPLIISLHLDCPDVGANGTRNWDIRTLADSPARFPALRHLFIERGRPGEHNRKIVGAIYEEDGVIGRLVAKAPSIESIVSPSAPSANFFDLPLERLRYLAIDAGYDAQRFIGNLAESKFTSLQSLEWGEYAETYIDGWQNRVTPLDDMIKLFESRPFAGVKRMVLKNPTYPDIEIERLAAMRPGMSLSVVRVSQTYVRPRRAG